MIEGLKYRVQSFLDPITRLELDLHGNFEPSKNAKPVTEQAKQRRKQAEKGYRAGYAPNMTLNELFGGEVVEQEPINLPKEVCHGIVWFFNNVRHSNDTYLSVYEYYEQIKDKANYVAPDPEQSESESES
jgi:hypothetical protein